MFYRVLFGVLVLLLNLFFCLILLSILDNLLIWHLVLLLCLFLLRFHMLGLLRMLFLDNLTLHMYLYLCQSRLCILRFSIFYVVFVFDFQIVLLVIGFCFLQMMIRRIYSIYIRLFLWFHLCLDMISLDLGLL